MGFKPVNARATSSKVVLHKEHLPFYGRKTHLPVGVFFKESSIDSPDYILRRNCPLPLVTDWMELSIINNFFLYTIVSLLGFLFTHARNISGGRRSMSGLIRKLSQFVPAS
jgi:hypothetical protein